MRDIYEEAADIAGVPDELRRAVIAEAKAAHLDVLRTVADRMHELLMGRLARDGKEGR